MYTIGIYPRKSVYRDNSDSVSVQVKLCQDYAGIVFKGKEIEFIVYDKDEGYSGKNMNRPGFMELMEDVKSGRLNAVMVYKLDRISRNVQEFSSMYEIFRQHNVDFISVKESFDTSTPMGRTVMYILAAFAQLERENISERVADNMQALGASGKWTGGKLPTGMTSIRRRNGDKEHSYLMIDPDRIGLVKLLYRLILQGYTITRIERHCRDHGIRSQGGKFLSVSQIHGILTNPVYCQNSTEAYYYFKDLDCTLPDQSQFDGQKGLIGYGRTRTWQTSHKKQAASDWIISVGIHDYVIPSGEWIAAQKRLGTNKIFRTAKYQVGILKGVIRCQCGARMDIRTYTKNELQFSYYYCADMARQGKNKCSTGYIPIHLVEKLFLDQLQKIRLNPEGFKIRERDDSIVRNIFIVRSEIKQLEQSIENLTAALMQAMESSASTYIISQINELDRQKKVLDSELRRAQLRQSAGKSLADAKDEIYNNICFLVDNFDSLEYGLTNELIRKIVKTCVFDGKNLRIIF